MTILCIIELYGVIQILRKINENEIQHGLTWPPINDFLHNNQPKTGSRDGEDYGGERDEREARWSAISLFSGGGKSNLK